MAQSCARWMRIETLRQEAHVWSESTVVGKKHVTWWGRDGLVVVQLAASVLTRRGRAVERTVEGSGLLGQAVAASLPW